MKILFDHSVPAKLRRALSGHLVVLARTLGWESYLNGDLLQAAEAEGFEILLTADQNLSYQQNNAKRRIALVVLSTNTLQPLLACSEEIQAALDRAADASYELVAIPLPKRSR